MQGGGLGGDFAEIDESAGEAVGVLPLLLACFFRFPPPADANPPRYTLLVFEA